MAEPPDHADGPASFVRHARTVAGLTLLSRISGLARDAVCSRVFGTSAVWSAFVTAFMIPNLFRRLFGEGALSAAFIPRYTRLCEHNDGPDASDRFASLTLWLLSATLGGLTLLGELALLAVLLWGGGDSGLRESAVRLITLMMVMLPYMPLVCVTAILGGMLQVRGRFAPHAAAPIMLNVAMAAGSVLGVLAFDDLTVTAYLVACGVVLAGVGQIVWCVWRLKGLVRWQLAVGDAWTQVRGMLLAMGPVIIGMGALQLSSLIDALIAGYPLAIGPSVGWGGWAIAFPLDEQSAAVLYFAQRLYQFPLGVFGIAIATAVFPALARAGARAGRTVRRGSAAGEPGDTPYDGDGDGGASFSSTLREGIRLSLFIAWPATLGLLIVREPLTAVLYAGGDFAHDDIARVSGVLAGYALAVWAYAMTHVFTRSFYALDDTRTPMRVGLVSVLANVALNLALIWPLREAGLAWSTGVCASGQALALAWLLRIRIRSLPGSGGRLLDAASRRSVGLTLAVGVTMATVLWLCDGLLIRRIFADQAAWSGHAIRLVVLMVAGVGLYGLLALALRLPELGWMLRAVGLGHRRGQGKPDMH